LLHAILLITGLGMFNRHALVRSSGFAFVALALFACGGAPQDRSARVTAKQSTTPKDLCDDCPITGGGGGDDNGGDYGGGDYGGDDYGGGDYGGDPGGNPTQETCNACIGDCLSSCDNAPDDKSFIQCTEKNRPGCFGNCQDSCP
jgi:hypothetical protein